ncbi:MULTISPECIES: M48 family metallopeptidase [Comamonas]|uniref:M48 family metallopeptidase n=1 Tax=Comamonas TaxID=283 RepID=UPI00050F0957|nr:MULTISPECIES: M48 family metallopeptidase [Comamonas]KGG86275.1 peptidase M48 [Comamonas thiooxydans]KGG97904.1 peptidase M48 [Comamonas thiooxydans]KGH08922.1 peptidase M48 [Comamonas thiooxydans]TZG12477.1 M48 family metallopeptidase [Comamonas thiooxydans]UBQ42826.1 M48 family metallopeptidase [Comamonas thiooxydans]
MASRLDFTLALSLLFATAVALQWLLRVWLVSRQVRHVATHRGAVPPAFAHRISLSAHQKAADYTLAKARVSLIDITLSAAVLLCWTLLGGLDWLNRWLLEFISPGLWQQLALLASFAVISALIELPLSLYQTFKLEQRFGFNQMTPGLWLADLLKSTLVGAIIGLPLAALILWLMGGAGPLWWLWAWGAWTAFNLLLMWIFPSFIAPLFNKFEPLADESLKSRVTRLMERCGFAAKGLFVMDGSRRSAHANAYFTGFGNSKRVVFFDTLLRQLSPGEVEAVLAHELGHFKHKHISKRMVLMFGVSLLGFALLGWLSQQLWFYTGLGVSVLLGPNIGVAAENNALALLLFMLAVPVFSFFVTPLMSAMSRRDEFEADAYAMQQADGAQLASALLKLYEDNASTLTPDPWYVSFYYSHPPAVDRLARMPAPAGSL